MKMWPVNCGSRRPKVTPMLSRFKLMRFAEPLKKGKIFSGTELLKSMSKSEPLKDKNNMLSIQAFQPTRPKFESLKKI
jgi:hypothetical protein